MLPLSIGDGELCETALTTISVVEMFRYWLQGGRMTVGFLGGAQIDRFANLNTTVIGALSTSRRCGCPAAAARPRSRAPAARSSSSWRSRKRSFVDKLDFITSMGHGEGGDHRARLGLKTKGPTKLITDLCVFEPDPVIEGDDGHLDPSGRHARADRGEDRLAGALCGDAAETPPPTAKELQCCATCMPHRAHTAAA